MNYADSTDSLQGFDVFLRTLGYAGPEVYCDGTNNCASRPVTLTAGPGFNSLTGLGSIGPSFISTFSKF